MDDGWPDEVTLVPKPTRRRLNYQQLRDYEHHRQELLEWALQCGKSVTDGKGYAASTMKTRAYQIDKFYRWVWEREGEYTTSVTHDHADEYLEEVAYSDIAQWTKCGLQNALKTLYQWRRHECGWDVWEPERTFSQPNDGVNDRDYINTDERRALRSAVLEYEASPHYESFDPEERRRYKQYVANQTGKHLDAVSVDDGETVSSWKYVSLVFASLDTGLLPIEVERASVDWVDLKQQILRIPAESSKNDLSWRPAITDRTAMAPEEWLHQREYLPLYDDTDALWLTQHGNAYNSKSLSRLMDRLCEIAGINTMSRQVTWYSIRRGLATGLIEAKDMSTAQTQLRHKDPRSTARYDQASPGRRRDGLEKLE